MPESAGATDQRDERIVRGMVTFARALPAEAAGKLYVRLLDVTAMDAPARVVAEQALPIARGAVRAEFELRATGIDERAMYVVAAHADLDGDGRYSVGDFVTTQSYPVLTRGRADRVDIVLKPVE